MSRLFVGNFSFELARIPGGTLPARIVRFEAEMACIWMAIAEAGDAILCELPFEDNYWRKMQALGLPHLRTIRSCDAHSLIGAEIVSWGWTPPVRRLARSSNFRVSAPDQEIVWKVNSREFQIGLCRDLNCLLPGEEAVHSLSALEKKLDTENWQRDWIVKPNFGQAGRGHIRGRGNRLSGQQQSGIRNLLARQQPVTIEPALSPIFELGGQWEIPREGSPVLVGISQLLTDQHGGYRGSGTNDVEIDPAARETIRHKQRQAAERLQQAGYFGPAGIDAMIHRNGEQVAVRPIQDINARWTMGRMALQWGLRLNAIDHHRFRSGFWLHSRDCPDPDAILLSPDVLGGEPVRHLTWWKPGR